MRGSSRYKVELIRGGIALGTTTLALATTVVVIYAWISGSRDAEELLKVLAFIVTIGTVSLAVTTFYIEKKK